MKNSPKKKTILLCILFAVVYCIHGVSGPAHTMYQAMQTGVFASHSFLGWYHIMTVVLVAAVYLPLSIQINRLTKEANMRVLRGLSMFFIIALSAFLVLNAIAISVWLINPEILG